jgi:hypothetical protein
MKQSPFPKQEMVAGRNITLSECAEDYLRALSNPFGNFINPPCIPDTVAIPSFKYKSVARGTMTVGTGGVGWVALDPWKAWSDGNHVLTYTTFPVLATTSAYTASTYGWQVIAGVMTTGVVGHNHSSFFTYTQLTDRNGVAQRQYRVVGAGIRLMYSGTELNRGGRLTLYRNRSGSDTLHAGGVTSSSFLNDLATQQTSVTRNWREITHVPDAPEQLGYEGGWNYTDEFAPALGTNDKRTLIAFVDGAVAGTSFQYETVIHYEFVGTSMPVTPSHSDPAAMGAIVSAVPSVAATAAQGLYNALKRGTVLALQNSTAFLSSGTSARRPQQARQLLLTN